MLMKITRTMKHTPDLHPVFKWPVEDEMVAKTLHAPGTQPVMPKLRSRTAHKRIFRQKLEAVIGRLQKAAGQAFVIGTKMAVDGLQVAEHILALIVTGRHQQEAIMRSILPRSPALKLLWAASSRRSWMWGGVSSSSDIHRSNAWRATSSASRYPWEIWRWIKACIGLVTVISMSLKCFGTALMSRFTPIHISCQTS